MRVWFVPPTHRSSSCFAHRVDLPAGTLSAFAHPLRFAQSGSLSEQGHYMLLSVSDYVVF
ncbi:uncharacterized protein LACBIDRAFT_297627 [Laccaria bicolor S238N-H82]|uniref:Predicted protein n=1 Tax=Laccaria bicolor (strain S238N-H82 / ATCC MYA-4686) TaxID=486041 RepID=B0DBM6_LACBS|nr:uncharacterized protein LACBIDRAFT_297627 [Laccaria bicolor S238N-H82]EDR08025.1 predicted protein [Laccaria bicolor S238N-H82]|eukprot:XP_001881095.1 predicted protein [Laccaria bicolor S238N-H82]